MSSVINFMDFLVSHLTLRLKPLNIIYRLEQL